jgi:beta-glucanase (GH16 family)
MPEPATEPSGEHWRHRKSNRGAGMMIAGSAAAVALILLTVATFGFFHGRDDAPATKTAATAPAEQPSAISSPPVSVAPKPSPTPSRAPSTSSRAAKTTTPVKAGVPAPPSGFTLTWADAFNGDNGAGLDRDTYRYDTGNGKFGTGEVETMTDSTRNVFHDGDGHLVLRALHGGGDPDRGWTSGRFETQSDGFGADKGGVVRIQASIQQPLVDKSTGAGYWPAFWMLGEGLRDGGSWPGIGEIDIMEDVNGRSSVFGTLHCDKNPGGECDESTGLGSGERPCAGCQTGFHTYAVEIDRSTATEKIRWYLDGRNYFTISEDRVGGPAWAKAVDHSFFIIFDLAMGGGFPDAFGGGPDDDTISGAAMKIDYVAVYNRR